MLESVRQRLYPFARRDVDELYLIRGDIEAKAFWDWPADCNLDDTLAFAENMLGDVKAGVSLHWTARLKSTNKFVGIFDLSELGATEDAELGFMVERSQWGQGLASEACAAVLDEAWSMGCNRVKARIHSGNRRSLRLLRHLGFQPPEISSAVLQIRPGVSRECLFFELAKPIR